MRVEVVVAQLLAGLGEPGALVEGDGVALSYLPFTDLGLDQGGALCWEVMLSRAGVVEQVGMGEHALLALGDLPAVPAASARAEELQRAWAGWGALLGQAVVITSRGPASPLEPSVAVFNVEAVWSSASGSPGWAWRAGGMEVLDDRGRRVGVRWWQGATPAAALGAALEQAGTWWQREPRTWGRR